MKKINIYTKLYSLIGLKLIIDGFVYLFGINSKLLHKKLQIGILIILLKTSIPSHAQTFFYESSCYLNGPPRSGKDRFKNVKPGSYHDIQIGNKFISDYNKALTIGYGYNIWYFNVGANFEYHLANDSQKGIFNGIYFKTAPLDFFQSYTWPVSNLYAIVSTSYHFPFDVKNEIFDYKSLSLEGGLLYFFYDIRLGLELDYVYDFMYSSYPIKNRYYFKFGVHYYIFTK